MECSQRRPVLAALVGIKAGAAQPLKAPHLAREHHDVGPLHLGKLRAVRTQPLELL